MAQSPALVAPTVDALGYPDLIGCLALICELGRILDKQDRTAARSKTASRGGEVTAEDFRFFDTIKSTRRQRLLCSIARCVTSRSRVDNSSLTTASRKTHSSLAGRTTRSSPTHLSTGATFMPEC